jgi:hypothetical protein
MERVDATEKNQAWTNEEVQSANDLVHASTEKHDWSSVREPATRKNDRCTRKNIGASQEKHLAARKKTVGATKK